MAVRIGFLVEGHDYLILRVLLAKCLAIPEEEVVVCGPPADTSGHGWSLILDAVERELRKLYGQCAQAAVIGVDNDGNVDLRETQGTEDPNHPRHWNHAGRPDPHCRFCQLSEKVERTRRELDWLGEKPGARWPVIVAVPVEMIETWLLTARKVVRGDVTLRDLERCPRGPQKRQFYGKPEAARAVVEKVALPLCRQLTQAQLEQMAELSRSFGLFRQQVSENREAILSRTDCWQPGDRAGEDPSARQK